MIPETKRKVKKDVWLVYDYACPFCDAYCRAIRIKRDIGTLHLVDAREPSKIMNEITKKGLDIDNGMILRLDESLYYGSDAINILTLISSPIGIFNRLNYWVFSSKTTARILYPLFREIRNFILFKVMRKPRINNLGKRT